MSKIVPHITATPVVTIAEGVGRLAARSGDETLDQAISVKMLSTLRDRIDRALARYGNGEEHIIES